MLALVITAIVTAVITHVASRGLAFRPASVPVQWDLWGILTAVGTVGATVVAVWLALRSLMHESNAVARVVAAWVTENYTPRGDISAYRRTVTVHLANESNEPVSDVAVSVFLGQRFRYPVGPLSVPSTLSTLPPRRELTFDISIPLLAFEDTWDPRVEMRFTDPSGRRWWRDIEGKLAPAPTRAAKWIAGDPSDRDRQLGIKDSPINPMMVAFAFLNTVRQEKVNRDDVELLLAPEAEGWSDIDDWENFGASLERYQPTSMVDYPAPQIARVKLSGDIELQGMEVEGEAIELEDYKFMTLTFTADRGWRVFGVGGSVKPEEILFPPDAFDERE